MIIFPKTWCACTEIWRAWRHFREGEEVSRVSKTIEGSWWAHQDGQAWLPWTCSPYHTCCAGQASFQIQVKHDFHVVNHASVRHFFRVLLPGKLRHHVLKIGKINPNNLRILMGLVLFFASNSWKATIQDSIYLPNIVPGPWSNCWG